MMGSTWVCALMMLACTAYGSPYTSKNTSVETKEFSEGVFYDDNFYKIDQKEEEIRVHNIKEDFSSLSEFLQSFVETITNSSAVHNIKEDFSSLSELLQSFVGTITKSSAGLFSILTDGFNNQKEFFSKYMELQSNHSSGVEVAAQNSEESSVETREMQADIRRLETKLNLTSHTLATLAIDKDKLKKQVARLNNITFAMSCPEPFRGWERRCLFASEDVQRASWIMARSTCGGIGGDLATTISHEPLHNFLKEHYSAGYERFWVGASDAEEEGIFKWLDGRPVDRSQFLPGQPDGGQHDDCMYLYRGKEPPFADMTCISNYRYICEYKMDE